MHPKEYLSGIYIERDAQVHFLTLNEAKQTTTRMNQSAERYFSSVGSRDWENLSGKVRIRYMADLFEDCRR